MIERDILISISEAEKKAKEILNKAEKEATLLKKEMAKEKEAFLNKG